MNNNNQCPVLMSDARSFTDYRPRYDVNKALMAQLNVADAANYRVSLQTNADSIINSNSSAAEYRNKCECSDMTNIPFSSCRR
jgi:hypothetical protein